MAPGGKLLLAQAFTVQNGKITAVDLVADPDRLETLELAVLDA